MEDNSGAQRDLKAVAFTKFIAPLPSYRKSMLLIVVISFIAGFALSILFFKDFSPRAVGDYFLFGGAEGVLILGVPGILSAAFAASITRKERFRDRLRHFSFIALLSVTGASILYILGLLFSRNLNQLQSFVLLSNTIIFGIWFVALFITLNYGWKTILLSVIQPALNISFVTIYKSFLLANLQDPFILAIKFLVSAAVLLLALGSIVYIINAPARRNFGISTLQVLALFSAQWTYGSKGLEEILAEMGERVETFFATVIFRGSRSKKLKALWLVPYVHYGPIGNLGGSEFPYLIANPLSKKYPAPIAVFHATVNHDFNPVYSALSEKFVSAYDAEIRRLGRGKFEDLLGLTLLESKRGTNRIFGLNFGRDDGFFAFSNAPNSTEDIELPIGMIMMNKFKSKGLREAVLVDMHNSKTDGSYMLPGTPEFFEFYDLIDKFKTGKLRKFGFGSSADPLQEFGLQQGIGRNGIVVSVFEIARKRICIILFDANNVLPDFRREMLLKIAHKFRFDFCDVLTTDTHAVNNISGIHNPLGRYCDRKRLIARVEELIQVAIDDMEPAEAAMSMARIEIDVLGARRSPEVISTINSIVSIAKIFAPSILIISLFIAFLLMLGIK